MPGWRARAGASQPASVGLVASEKDEGPAGVLLRAKRGPKGEQPIGTGLASGHKHTPPRTHTPNIECGLHLLCTCTRTQQYTVIISTTTADRCALHWTTRGRPPNSIRPQLPNGLPHYRLEHVEISGWADIASMQEHVAHLPDAVRRDRWSRGYWMTAPSYHISRYWTIFKLTL